jgi:hypothetical protein
MTDISCRRNDQALAQARRSRAAPISLRHYGRRARMTKERFNIHRHLTDRVVSTIEAATASGRCHGTAAAAVVTRSTLHPTKSTGGVNMLAP